MNQSFDAELEALSKAIRQEQVSDHKNKSVSTPSGKERLHLALKEKISELLPSAPAASSANTPTDVPLAPPPSTTVKKISGSKSYLDTVDDATVSKVNEYVGMIFDKGIQSTIKEVVESDPFLLDVFHDALTDKLYTELKSRGIVS